MEDHRTESIDAESYELFQRAIREGDEEAWAESVIRYRPLLIAWARGCNAQIPTYERYDDIADRAFSRAWMALAPARRANFPNLAAVLGYLHACVNAVAVDAARAERLRSHSASRVDMSVASAEQIVLKKMEYEELWQIVGRHARTKREQVILAESFIFGRSPNAILTRHPGLFENIATLYQTKRNLLDRIRNDANIRRYQPVC